MHKAIVDYARAGNNVIVDYILYDSQWIYDLAKFCKKIPVYVIGIRCDLNTLEEREKKRGTSPEGHARTLHESVHKNCIYDLEIDVTHKKPEETAAIINNYIMHYKPTALKTLRKNVERA